MARHCGLLIFSIFTFSMAVQAADCSNVPSEDEKRLLCAGETHPMALKLCSETLSVKRDKYGRVLSHSYKADATLPEMALLSKMCDVALMPDKSEKAVSECRSTMRVKVNLDGKPVGYSYRIGGHDVDMLLDRSAVKQVGDGGYLCKDEPANTLNRKVCMDGLNFEQDGDYITTYTHSAVANFTADEDAKVVCKDEKEGSKEFEYCKATTKVFKNIDGTIAFTKPAESSMGNDFKPMAPVCEKPIASNPIVPKSEATVPEVREEFSTPPVMQIGRALSSSGKCEGLTGQALTQCISGATGETTVVNFDGCKAVWGLRAQSKGVGEKSGADRVGAPAKPKIHQE